MPPPPSSTTAEAARWRPHGMRRALPSRCATTRSPTGPRSPPSAPNWPGSRRCPSRSPLSSRHWRHRPPTGRPAPVVAQGAADARRRHGRFRRRRPNTCCDPARRVLIDGYNVAKLAWPKLDLEGQRVVLLDAVENLARRFGSDITVVFDGADVVGANTDRATRRPGHVLPGTMSSPTMSSATRSSAPGDPPGRRRHQRPRDRPRREGHGRQHDGERPTPLPHPLTSRSPPGSQIRGKRVACLRWSTGVLSAVWMRGSEIHGKRAYLPLMVHGRAFRGFGCGWSVLSSAESGLVVGGGPGGRFPRIWVRAWLAADGG